jgi:3-hydroxyacyl-[acyl-carrier-protein] dehydratase
MTMRPDVIRSLLPWRHPFLMVDRVLSCEPHRRIVTTRGVTADEAMANRGAASLAGMMIVEGMSQSAALLFQLSYGRLAQDRIPLLGSLKASWTSPAHPGDVIVFTVDAIKMTSTMGIFSAAAGVAGETIATAELAFAVADPLAGRPAAP